jgi:hypothetical protein
MPTWPFIILGLLSFIAFGLTDHIRGRTAALLRAVFLTVASLLALAAGIILQFAEPWNYRGINVHGHDLRGQVLVSIIIEATLNFLLAWG